MKKIILLIFTLLLPLTTYAIPLQSEDIYLTDNANIISDETKEYILNYSEYIKKIKNIDYYVVTVKNTENIDPENYIDYIYNSFNISNKGILILAFKDERRINVKVGEELSAIITNEIIEDYLKNYFKPYLKNDEWDNSIKNGYSAFYKLLCNYYNIDSSEVEVHTGEDYLTKYRFPILMLIIWLTTISAYIFCTFFKRFVNKENLNIIDYIVFPIFLFINIISLVISYKIKSISVLLIILFEISIIVGYFNYNSKEEKKKRKRKR